MPVANVQPGTVSPEELDKLDEPTRKERALPKVESVAHLFTIITNSTDDPSSPITLYNVGLELASSGDIVFVNARRQGGRLSSKPLQGRSSDHRRTLICGENLRANQENCDITTDRLESDGVPILWISSPRSEAALSMQAFTKRVPVPERVFAPTAVPVPVRPVETDEVVFNAQTGGYVRLLYPEGELLRNLEIKVTRVSPTEWRSSVQQIQLDASFNTEGVRTGIRSLKITAGDR